MKKLMVLLLVVLGIVGGSAAGIFLKPGPAPDNPKNQIGEDAGHIPAGEDERSFVKIGRQTIVPVVENGETRALMLFELAIDVKAGENDNALRMEPRLRDAFLRELFEMSYTGAFMTTFTDDRIIEELRTNLTRAARAHLGDAVNEVLILDVMRQEM